jgi:hypothetical protein
LIPDDGLGTTPTNCAHILGRSTNEGINSSKKVKNPTDPVPKDPIFPQPKYTAGAWAIIQRFGNISVIDELNGDSINRLENIITMAADVHGLFDTLEIWFEETVRHFNAVELVTCLTIQLKKSGHCRSIHGRHSTP